MVITHFFVAAYAITLSASGIGRYVAYLPGYVGFFSFRPHNDVQGRANAGIISNCSKSLSL